MSKMIWPIVALLALSACDSNSNVRITTTSSSDSGSVLKVIDALQCPTDQGALTRRGTASDGGQTCTYAGPRGSEVKLHLVSLDGQGADAVLKRFQDDLGMGAQLAAADGPVTATDASASDTEATAGGDSDRATVRLPGMSVDAQGDRATVALPGMKIEADGDRANIRIGGLTIRADDTGSHITATDGDRQAVIKATDAGAEIRTDSKNAVRATMMNVVANPGPSGWRVVGYEARGPSSGPIVVATYRSRDRDPDDMIEAAKALVALNVGD